MTDDERWRPVLGREGLYEVSDLGRVRSLDRVVSRSNGRPHPCSGQVLTPAQHGNGYLYVCIQTRPKTVSRVVHRLVLEAFVGRRPAGLQGCHWDGDPTNNRLGNLRWDTPSANQLDRIRHGRNNQVNKRLCNRGHVLVLPNLTAKSVERGWRRCLACVLAHSAVPRGLGSVERELLVQEESDRRFSLIMAGGSGRIERGMAFGSGQVHTPSIDVDRCVALYSQGLSSLAIARELSSSSSVVLRTLQTANVDRRSTGGARQVDHARCVELYQLGLSSEAVARELECHPTTVLEALRRMSVPVRPPHRRITADAAECKALHDQGLSCKKIAVLVGCSPMSVSRLLQEASATNRSAGGV